MSYIPGRKLSEVRIQIYVVFRIQIQLESELNTRFSIQTELDLFKFDSKHEFLL